MKQSGITFTLYLLLLFLLVCQYWCFTDSFSSSDRRKKACINWLFRQY